MAYYGDPQSAMYEWLEKAIFDEMRWANDSEFEKTIRETNDKQNEYQARLDKAEKETRIQENKAWEKYATKQLKQINAAWDMSVYKNPIIPGVTPDVYKKSPEEMRRDHPEQFKKFASDQMKEDASQDTRVPRVSTTWNFNNSIIQDPMAAFKAPTIWEKPQGAPVVPGAPGAPQDPQIGWSANLPNQYTFADWHKEFDSTAIPEQLNKWKIRPAEYFTKKGLNWMKDAPRIAKEMGMEWYRGTPGQNYQLVQYLEKGKAWDKWRQFNDIEQQSAIRNRFSKEENDKLMTMDENARNKFLQERDLSDLKKMLPWNVGLINKVFGTNYTSDDLTGGIGRQTIMGSGGMTAKGIEVQNLINGLKPGDATKFMGKWGEFDNSQADSGIITSNSGVVQMGRRKLLEDMVDKNQSTLSGSSLDAQDNDYIKLYREYKDAKPSIDHYNKLISEYNGMDKTNVLRNKSLQDIQKFVNTLQISNATVYNKFKAELDKIPEFIKSWKAIPTANAQHPGETADKAATKPVAGDTPAPNVLPVTSTPVWSISKNNIVPPTATQPVTPETIQKQPVIKEDVWEMKVVDWNNKSLTSKWGNSYAPKEYETNVGYSSNSISKG